MNNDEELLSAKQAAKYLGMSIGALETKRRRGAIPFIVEPYGSKRHIKYRPSELDKVKDPDTHLSQGPAIEYLMEEFNSTHEQGKYIIRKTPSISSKTNTWRLYNKADLDSAWRQRECKVLPEVPVGAVRISEVANILNINFHSFQNMIFNGRAFSVKVGRKTYCESHEIERLKNIFIDTLIVSQVARILNVPYHSVKKLLFEGKLIAVGERPLRIRRAEVDAYKLNKDKYSDQQPAIVDQHIHVCGVGEAVYLLIKNHTPLIIFLILAFLIFQILLLTR